MLLETTIPFDYNLEEKSEGGRKKLFIEGIYQKANTENENRRVYSDRILSREVTALQETINDNRLMGEMQHPQSAEINPERACHLVKTLMMKENKIAWGKSLILEDTPFGDILAGLIRNGVKMGISSRGKGTVTYRGGINEVNDDYKMITFDIVSRPSTPGAFPNPIMESKQNGNYVSLTTLTEKILSGEMTKSDITEVMSWEPGKKKIFF